MRNNIKIITNKVPVTAKCTLGFYRLGRFHLPIEVSTEKSSPYTIYVYDKHSWQEVQDCHVCKDYSNEKVEIILLQHAYHEQLKFTLLDNRTIVIDGGFSKKKKHEITISLYVKNPIKYIEKFLTSSYTDLKSYFMTKAQAEFKEYLIDKNYNTVNHILLQESGLGVKVIDHRFFYSDDGLTITQRHENDLIHSEYRHEKNIKKCIQDNEIDEMKVKHGINMKILKQQTDMLLEQNSIKGKLDLIKNILTLPRLSESEKFAILQYISGEKITALNSDMFFNTNNLLNNEEYE